MDVVFVQDVLDIITIFITWNLDFDKKSTRDKAKASSFAIGRTIARSCSLYPVRAADHCEDAHLFSFVFCAEQ